MSALASYALSRKMSVSGTDQNTSDTVNKLIEKGLNFSKGHKDIIFNEQTAIIYTSGINKENNELIVAKKMGCKVYKRGEFLSLIVNSAKVSIAICGAHGKTTTTSLMAHSFYDFDFTSFVGGIISEYNSNFLEKDLDKIITEADESDGSFLFLKPSTVVLTNIDFDHLDYYETKEKIIETYTQFLKTNKNLELLIYNNDDIHAKNVANKVHCKKASFGFSNEAKYKLRIIKENLFFTTAELKYEDKILTFSIPLNGAHNIQNAASCFVYGIEKKLDLEIIKKRIFSFSGTKRRSEVLKTNPFIINDYAHHPVEILSTVNALTQYEDFTVIFQPHRFSRTSTLWDEFIESLSKVNDLYILPVKLEFFYKINCL